MDFHVPMVTNGNGCGEARRKSMEEDQHAMEAKDKKQKRKYKKWRNSRRILSSIVLCTGNKENKTRSNSNSSNGSKEPVEVFSQLQLTESPTNSPPLPPPRYNNQPRPPLPPPAPLGWRNSRRIFSSIMLCTGNKEDKRKSYMSSSSSSTSNSSDEEPFEAFSQLQLTESPTNSPPLPPLRHNNQSGPPLPPRVPLGWSSKGVNLHACIAELLMSNVGWYWGALKINDAERLLSGRPDGCFLVRDSSSIHYLFSVSLQLQGKPIHLRVDITNSQFRLTNNVLEAGCQSLITLMDTILESTTKGHKFFLKQNRPGVPPRPVFIKNYVSRFEVLPSLKYLSRIAIRQQMRTSGCGLDQLQLPHVLLDYCKACPFYDALLVESIIDLNRSSSSSFTS